MAKKWTNIIKDEKFQNLNDEDKELLRDTYFEDNLSSNETYLELPEEEQQTIKQEFYNIPMKIEEQKEITPTEKFEQGLDKTITSIKDVAKNIPKGAASFVASLPQAVGGTLKELGERAEEKSTILDRLVSPITGSGLRDILSPVFKKITLDEKTAALGDKIIDANKDFIAKQPFLKQQGEGFFNELGYGLGSGGASLALAVGTSILTKSPKSAAVLFGLYQKSNVYADAREQGVDTKKAGQLSTLAGIVEGGLEFVGIDALLKRSGLKLKNLFKSGLTEGTQELSQQFGENAIFKLGKIDDRKMTDGLLMSSLVGFITGGGASVAMGSFQESEAAQDLKEKGMTEQEINTLASKPIQEGLNNVSNEFNKIDIEKEAEQLSKKDSKIKTAIDSIMSEEKREDFYQETVNRFASIENLSKKAKEMGLDLPSGADPKILARTYLGNTKRAEQNIKNNTFRINRDGQIEITGEGLKPILQDFDKLNLVETKEDLKEKDLTDYLVAKRTVEDLQREVEVKGKNKKIATEKQTQEAKTKIEELENKYGDKINLLEDTSQRLYGFQKRILYNLVDSGMLSQEQYDSILSDNPNYVPFERLIEEDGSVEISGAKKRLEGARTPIAKIKGSEKEVLNPLETIIKNTFKIMDASERNKIVSSIASLSNIFPEDLRPFKVNFQPIKLTAKEAGEDKVIFRPSQFKPKGNVVEYKDNGKRQFLEVTPNLYDALTGLNEESSDLLVKILAKPANILRTGATITPEFMARNVWRDQFIALMQTQLGFRPFVDTIGSFSDVLGKSELYNDWLRSGAAHSGMVELSRPELKKSLKELTKKPSLLRHLNIINSASEISQFFEQATRVGTYKAALRKGLDPLQAGFESRESTLDFARRGSKTKNVNKVVAFLNAQIQGFDKTVRVFGRDPIGTTIKGIATISIPEIFSYLLNRNDEGYQEIDRWQKDLFWIFNIDGTYVRIPKPFSYGQIFGSLLGRFMEFVDKKDPRALDDFASSFFESISPVGVNPVETFLPTAAKPLIENSTNYSFFRDRPIVSLSLERLIPELQYSKYTSESAKKLGEVLKMSPAKIENFITGISGGSGRYALQGADFLLNSIKKANSETVNPKRPTQASDIFGVKGFVTRDPFSDPRSLREFWDKSRQIQREKSSINKLEKDKDIDRLEDFKRKNSLWKLSKQSDNFKKQIKKITTQIDGTIENDKLTQKEKRDRLKILDLKRTLISNKANDSLDKNAQKLQGDIIRNSKQDFAGSFLRSLLTSQDKIKQRIRQTK